MSPSSTTARASSTCFWPGVLLVKQKSAGRDLKAAYEQAGEYFDALPERERPRYILVSDFQTFELHDLDERETVAFPLADLPAHVESFGFILGVQRRTFRDQDPANIKAAELVGRLHDALADAGQEGHDLERFLVRMVFCMFADDTGVFEPRDIFLDFIETRTSEDGADLGPWLGQLFEVLDMPEDRRAATLDEDLARFYGIEIGEFPARIAETALWMMDHIMNNRLSLEFGQTFVRIPLKKSPHIVHGDALEADWSGLLPSGKCSFVLGNPPFVGAKQQRLTNARRCVGSLRSARATDHSAMSATSGCALWTMSLVSSSKKPRAPKASISSALPLLPLIRYLD